MHKSMHALHSWSDQMCCIWISYAYAYTCGGAKKIKNLHCQKTTQTRNFKKNVTLFYCCNVAFNGETIFCWQIDNALRRTCLLAKRRVFLNFSVFLLKPNTSMPYHMLCICLVTSFWFCCFLIIIVLCFCVC